jgi:hypothetical protein
MKRRIVIVGVMLLMMAMGLFGCFFGSPRVAVDSKQEANAMADRIIDALETEDEDALKSVFSQKALVEAEDIDEGIAYIFDLYQGSHVEIERLGNRTSEHFGDPGQTKSISAQCNITTDEGKYVLAFIYKTIDEADPSAVGVRRIVLINYDEYTNPGVKDYGGDADRPGIYHRGWDGRLP